MNELEELRLAYAECNRQRNELLAKLKRISQTLKQEPVAWLDRTDLKNLSACFEPTISKKPVSEYDVPLYTSPQPLQQEPVAYVDPIWMQRPDLVMAHQLEIGKLFARSQFKDYVPLYTKQEVNHD
jgi:hypothetical protein